MLVDEDVDETVVAFAFEAAEAEAARSASRSRRIDTEMWRADLRNAAIVSGSAGEGKSIPVVRAVRAELVGVLDADDDATEVAGIVVIPKRLAVESKSSKGRLLSRRT